MVLTLEKMERSTYIIYTFRCKPHIKQILVKMIPENNLTVGSNSLRIINI